jgi:hypothetical protein
MWVVSQCGKSTASTINESTMATRVLAFEALDFKTREAATLATMEKQPGVRGDNSNITNVRRFARTRARTPIADRWRDKDDDVPPAEFGHRDKRRRNGN